MGKNETLGLAMELAYLKVSQFNRGGEVVRCALRISSCECIKTNRHGAFNLLCILVMYVVQVVQTIFLPAVLR